MDSDIGSPSQSRCYKVNCVSTSTIMINIGGIVEFCTTPGATVTVNSPYSGTFRCPDDFNVFCNGVPNSNCIPGQNGICAPDGSVICRKGHGGIGCLAITCHSNCMIG
jgi:hypothetical protein